MSTPSRRTLRYARAWLMGPTAFREDDLLLDRDGVEVPATVVRPARHGPDTPAWVVMHGITRPGRAHARLVRFTRAVASAGIVTIVPDVPEWRALRLSPHLTSPTVLAAIRGLRDAGFATDRRVGVVGFSFGAPHTIACAARPELRDEVAGACGFGGYGRLESTFRFMMSGHHEWEGRSWRLRPDPYGRWIVAANYLTGVPEHDDATDVADALRELATEAGDHGAPAWDAVYDPTIARLREGIAEERRALFDAFAPPSAMQTGRADRARPTPPELAEGLAAAARRIDPGIDPTAGLARVEHPVSLLHGRDDHLIPFTEAYRLRDALSATRPAVTVTRLFGHSGDNRFPLGRAAREVPEFARALTRVLGLA